MRLDHVSYVASHDQISDVVQRIGSQIGTAFVDGGIHPQFGTRNFTAPLLNGQYIEVVCPLDHPAAENTAFGRAVTKKATEGGGWLSWVFSTNDISIIEKKFSRPAMFGHRKKPDGSNLEWAQLGVAELLTSQTHPFFIEWKSGAHPSSDGRAETKIQKIFFNGSDPLSTSLLSEEIRSSLNDVQISINVQKTQNYENEITKIEFTKNGNLIEVV
jgi:Glyoxalase-like domain